MTNSIPRRTSNRFEQINRIVDEHFPELPPRYSCLLVVAWRFADKEARFKISTAMMATLLGISKRQVVDIFSELKQMGLIRVIKEGSGRKASIYKLGFPRDQAASGEGGRISTEEQSAIGAVKSSARSGEVPCR